MLVFQCGQRLYFLRFHMSLPVLPGISGESPAVESYVAECRQNNGDPENGRELRDLIRPWKEEPEQAHGPGRARIVEEEENSGAVVLTYPAACRASLGRPGERPLTVRLCVCDTGHGERDQVREGRYPYVPQHQIDSDEQRGGQQAGHGEREDLRKRFNA